MPLRTTTAALLAATLLSACGSNQEDTRPRTDASSAHQSASEPVAEGKQAQAEEPKHYYSLMDEGKYGYESALTPNDVQMGKGAGTVMMVEYLGNANGAYKFYWKNGNAEYLLTCKEPCEFAKTKTAIGGYPGGEETMRVATGTLAWEMIEDARRGFLEGPKPVAVAPAAPQPVQAAQPEAKEIAAKPIIPIPGQDSSAGQ